MNIAFLLGKQIEQGNFKFIVSKKIRHKSQYTFKFQLIDGNTIEMVGYDEIADFIAQNKPINMLIQGNLKSEAEKQIQVEINSLLALKSSFCKQTFIKNIYGIANFKSIKKYSKKIKRHKFNYITKP